jgi:hypothetical protein
MDWIHWILSRYLLYLVSAPGWLCSAAVELLLDDLITCPAPPSSWWSCLSPHVFCWVLVGWFGWINGFSGWLCYSWARAGWTMHCSLLVAGWMIIWSTFDLFLCVLPFYTAYLCPMAVTHKPGMAWWLSQALACCWKHSSSMSCVFLWWNLSPCVAQVWSAGVYLGSGQVFGHCQMSLTLGFNPLASSSSSSSSSSSYWN